MFDWFGRHHREVAAARQAVADEQAKAISDAATSASDASASVQNVSRELAMLTRLSVSVARNTLHRMARVIDDPDKLRRAVADDDVFEAVLADSKDPKW